MIVSISFFFTISPLGPWNKKVLGGGGWGWFGMQYLKARELLTIIVNVVRWFGTHYPNEKARVRITYVIRNY